MTTEPKTKPVRVWCIPNREFPEDKFEVTIIDVALTGGFFKVRKPDGTIVEYHRTALDLEVCDG